MSGQVALAPWQARDYTPVMNGFVLALVVVALLMVLAVLLTGVVGMAKGGDFNRKYGNVLMRWRVALQGLAVVLILLALLASQS